MSTYTGVDLSVHNGFVDMKKVKSAGISFVMLRSSYGDITSYPKQKDGRFEQNYSNAKANGLNVGVYHYMYATTVAGAKREAEGFVKLLKGRKMEYPVALDIEESSQYSMSSTNIGNLITAFISVVEKAGYYCFLYSYEAFLNKVPADIRNRYDIWCANISRTPSIKYGMHQYSFTGQVNGISGRVDMNRTSKEYPTTMKEKGLNGFTKTSTAKVLDTTGYKKGDSTIGSLALKQMIQQAKNKKLCVTGVDESNGVVGDGTISAINELLKKWGYSQNSIAGANFIKKLGKALIG